MDLRVWLSWQPPVRFCRTGLNLCPPGGLADRNVLIGPEFDSEYRHKPAAYIVGGCDSHLSAVAVPRLTLTAVLFLSGSIGTPQPGGDRICFGKGKFGDFSPVGAALIKRSSHMEMQMSYRLISGNAVVLPNGNSKPLIC